MYLLNEVLSLMCGIHQKKLCGATAHCMLHQKGGGADVLCMRSMLKETKSGKAMATPATPSYALQEV